MEDRDGYSRIEKNQMMLSAETLLGLKITGLNISYFLCMYITHFAVRSFIEFVEFVFTIPGVHVFLSNKLSQDNLEKFFGQQRQRGRVNENPDAMEFIKNTQAL